MQIVSEILRSAEGGIQKTQLVFQTNINFTLLKKYQSLLAERGFLLSNNGQVYNTEKGMAFLEKYEELIHLWRVSDEKTDEELVAPRI